MYSRELTEEDLRRLDILQNRRDNVSLSDETIESMPSYKLRRSDFPRCHLTHGKHTVKKRERKASEKEEEKEKKLESKGQL